MAGVELTVDQFLAALGLEDTDGFAEYMKNSLPDASVDGTYSYSDGVLETDGEKSRVELSGDKLVIVEVTEAAGENEAINAALLPMTLTKVD